MPRSLLEIQAHLQNKAGSWKSRGTNDVAEVDNFGMILELMIPFHSLLKYVGLHSPEQEREEKGKKCLQ